MKDSNARALAPLSIGDVKEGIAALGAAWPIAGKAPETLKAAQESRSQSAFTAERRALLLAAGDTYCEDEGEEILWNM